MTTIERLRMNRPASVTLSNDEYTVLYNDPQFANKQVTEDVSLVDGLGTNVYREN